MVHPYALFICLIVPTVLFSSPGPRILGSGQEHNGLPACTVSDAQADLIPAYPCLAIVEFKENVPIDQRAQILAHASARNRFYFGGGDLAAVVLPNASSLIKIKESLSVKRIFPDNKIEANAKKTRPGTPVLGQIVPEGVKSVGAAPGVLSVHGEGIGVAVIDTGVDLESADLSVSSDCFSTYSECQDKNGHGTHVSGIIGAKNNDIGVVGVAPSSTIYAVKSLDDRGTGTDSSVIAGLEWIIDNADRVSPTIRVVNMSLGRFATADDSLMQDKIRELTHSLGISVIVAAGNEPGFEISDMVPAGFPEVIAVASTTANSGSSKCRGFPYPIAANTASYFTTDGPGVTISAPGDESEDISRACFVSSNGLLSLAPGGGTARMSGTSMAAPHVTGVVALLQEKCDNSIDPLSVRQILRASAEGIGSTPLDSPVSSYSYDGVREGIVSAGQALNACH